MEIYNSVLNRIRGQQKERQQQIESRKQNQQVQQLPNLNKFAPATSQVTSLNSAGNIQAGTNLTNQLSNIRQNRQPDNNNMAQNIISNSNSFMKTQLGLNPLSGLQNQVSQLNQNNNNYLQPMANSGQNNAPKSGIVQEGLKYQGTKYVWGGNNLSKGVDCSGLTQQLFSQQGIKLPRTAAQQEKTGKAVSLNEAQEGDLVFFDTRGKGKATHVGIYMGNGQMLHAGSKGVTTTNINDKYWQSKFRGVRRQ